MPVILINGCETKQLSVLDRGFQYGDGLFETLRIDQGQPCHWSRHMTRLAQGCERLAISLPSLDLLRAEAEVVCRDFGTGVLKITVTRGVTERGYAYTGAEKPTRVVAAFPMPEFPEHHQTQGVKVRVCQTRLGGNARLAGIKHLNRLEQVLARAEWDDTDIAEGLMLDHNGKVIEGTMSNLFCVQNSHDKPILKTPLLNLSGVAGITRERIMQAAEAAGIAVQEASLTVDELFASQELFLSNTVMGIWPVRQLEHHTFTVGSVAHQLSQTLESQHD